MDIREALKEQYHGGLAMLADCVEKCPEDVWRSGAHPRTFWRITLHAAFFAQFYLGQDEAAFTSWPGTKAEYGAFLVPERFQEQFELPETIEPMSRGDTLDYIAYVDSLVDNIVYTLDLERADTGFPWYKDQTKLSHEIMSIRHVPGHVGQLSELLMARGIDTDWIGNAESY